MMRTDPLARRDPLPRRDPSPRRTRGSRTILAKPEGSERYLTRNRRINRSSSPEWTPRSSGRDQKRKRTKTRPRSNNLDTLGNDANDDNVNRVVVNARSSPFRSPITGSRSGRSAVKRPVNTGRHFDRSNSPSSSSSKRRREKTSKKSTLKDSENWRAERKKLETTIDELKQNLTSTKRELEFANAKEMKAKKKDKVQMQDIKNLEGSIAEKDTKLGQQSLVITQLRVEIEKLERSGLGNASNSDQKWGRGFIAHIKDELESHFSCAICTEVFIGPTVLECGHIFCNYCIEEWRRQDPRCPICRSVSTLKVKIQMLGDYIENVVQNTFTENAKSGRLAIIEERKEALDRPPPPPTRAPTQSWGANRRILRLVLRNDGINRAPHSDDLIDAIDADEEIARVTPGETRDEVDSLAWMSPEYTSSSPIYTPASPQPLFHGLFHNTTINISDDDDSDDNDDFFGINVNISGPNWTSSTSTDSSNIGEARRARNRSISSYTTDGGLNDFANGGANDTSNEASVGSLQHARFFDDDMTNEAGSPNES